LSDSNSDRLYRPDIDGIRAIAILGVVLYHAALPILSGGFTGVDIFFVISGYLIGGHIFAEVRAGAFSYLRFYQRRAKRILPAFYVVLVSSLVAALFLLSPSEASDFGRSALGATLSVANIVFWHYSGYFDTRSNLQPLLMTWSLGVEEQFYVVIPLLMVVLARIRRSLLLPAILGACFLSFLLAWRELGSYPLNVFFLLPERAWELGVGVALAVAQMSRKHRTLPAPLIQLLSVAGLISLLAPLFLLNARSPFPGVTALPSVLGTALIIALPSSWLNRRLLSLPPLVFVGRISYSWYLWHWPLLAFLRIVSGNHLPPLAAWLALAASFVVAILSYYFIEQPCRKSTRMPIPLLQRYAVVSVLLLAVCACVWVSRGIPQRFQQLAPIDRAAKLLSSDPCVIAHESLYLLPPCYDASDQRPAVALWGDSHAAALAPGLRSIAGAQGYGFIQLGHSGCMPLTGAVIYNPGTPFAARDCMNFNHRVLELLQANRRVQVVVLAGRWTDGFQRDVENKRWLISDLQHPQEIPTSETSKAIFTRALSASIQALQEAGKQVIVLEDVPNFDFDPLSRVRTAKIPLRHALATWMGADEANDSGVGALRETDSATAANQQLKRTLDSLHDVPLIELAPEFCPSGGQCAYRKKEQLFYSDDQHLTAEGARYALRDFHLPALRASGT
jgi:peptidoglycan/LPS O-acetylase OafA/YrhL